MKSIGIYPLLCSKPHLAEQMETLVRDHNLQMVIGKHVHLVSSSLKNPIVVTPRRKPVIRSSHDYTPGGNAA